MNNKEMTTTKLEDCIKQNEKDFNEFFKEKLSDSQIKELIAEFHDWLKGKQYGYFLEDHKTWINYGALKDKFPYDENDKQWELSRNLFINQCERKLKDLGLIEELKILNGNSK